jgi:Na+/proline symporter
MDLFITIFSGIMTFVFFIQPEIAAKIIHKNATPQKIKKAKKEIRKSLGIFSVIAFIWYFLRVVL